MFVIIQKTNYMKVVANFMLYLIVCSCYSKKIVAGTIDPLFSAYKI